MTAQTTPDQTVETGQVETGKAEATAWFRELPESRRDLEEAPLSLLVPVWLLVAANLWFGIDTRFSAGLAARAAGYLLGTSP